MTLHTRNNSSRWSFGSCHGLGSSGIQKLHAPVRTSKLPDSNSKLAAILIPISCLQTALPGPAPKLRLSELSRSHRTIDPTSCRSADCNAPPLHIRGADRTLTLVFQSSRPISKIWADFIPTFPGPRRIHRPKRCFRPHLSTLPFPTSVRKRSREVSETWRNYNYRPYHASHNHFTKYNNSAQHSNYCRSLSTTINHYQTHRSQRSNNHRRHHSHPQTIHQDVLPNPRTPFRPQHGLRRNRLDRLSAYARSRPA